MESHPHLHLFDASKNWKYLIIGTFPPNSAVRDKSYIDYFYGNKGFLWKIIHDIYNDRGYDFFNGDRHHNLQEIKRWQHDYCVGLSDTILSCTRKHPLSSNDSDLSDIIYNHALKHYVLGNLHKLEKIIFTSTFGKNSAFENFRIIMGDDIQKVSSKLVIGLPSPSGAANITFFNTNNEETLGLTDDFFKYVSVLRPEFIAHFRERWQLKKLKRSSPDNKHMEVPASPKGLVKDFKLWKYKNAFPQETCVQGT
jgi:G:T/U-mismatch repair DNA glycosylase